MKKLSLLILLVAAVTVCSAQSKTPKSAKGKKDKTPAAPAVLIGPKIQFDNTTYDFGTIHEEGGKVTGRFEFTNVGDSALVLTNVRPGCGCTAANYSHDPVAPGQRGFIEATYNPYNRPGGFNKNIRVTTNEREFSQPDAQPHMIFIKGEVIKRPPTEYEQLGYTKTGGMARIKEPDVQVKLLNTQSQNDTFRVHNFWNKPVTFTLASNPVYVTEVYRSFGQQLDPGKDGIIVLKYDASKRQAFGMIKDMITYTTNDSLDAKKTIHYAVNIKEDFSKLSAKQLEKAPVAMYNAVAYDFGQVQKNSVTTATITLTNNGKTPLMIRTISSSNGVYSASADLMTIPVKGKSIITINFKTNNRSGAQTGTLDVITNDPKNPVQVINLNGQVL